MGKYSTVKKEGELIYWPMRKGCIGLHVLFLSLILLGSPTVFIAILFEVNDMWVFYVLYGIEFVFYILSIVFMIKNIYIKVLINKEGIYVSNQLNKTSQYINWKWVYRIEHYKDKIYPTKEYYKILAQNPKGERLEVMLRESFELKDGELLEYFPLHIPVTECQIK